MDRPNNTDTSAPEGGAPEPPAEAPFDWRVELGRLRNPYTPVVIAAGSEELQAMAATAARILAEADDLSEPDRSMLSHIQEAVGWRVEIRDREERILAMAQEDYGSLQESNDELRRQLDMEPGEHRSAATHATQELAEYLQRQSNLRGPS